MGIDLHWDFYPKKCNDPQILSYLDTNPSLIDTWLDGKYLKQGFYEAAEKFGNKNSLNACYIFDDVTKLFEFANLDVCPESISTFITNFYDEEVPIFIIWKR